MGCIISRATCDGSDVAVSPVKFPRERKQTHHIAKAENGNSETQLEFHFDKSARKIQAANENGFDNELQPTIIETHCSPTSPYSSSLTNTELSVTPTTLHEMVEFPFGSQRLQSVKRKLSNSSLSTPLEICDVKSARKNIDNSNINDYSPRPLKSAGSRSGIFHGSSPSLRKNSEFTTNQSSELCRAQEYLMLKEAADLLINQGESSLFALIGEPGVGKTTMCEHLSNYCKSEGKIEIITDYAFESIFSPLSAFKNFFATILDNFSMNICKEKKFGEMTEFEREQLRCELSIKFKHDSISEKDFLYMVELICPELGVFHHNEQRLSSYDGSKMRKTLKRLCMDLVTSFVQKTPTVLFLHNFHWFDDLSRELLYSIKHQIPKNIMIIVTSNFLENIWDENILTANTNQVIYLKPLSLDNTEEFLCNHLNLKAIAPDILMFIFEKGLGNISFMIEIVTNLIESTLAEISADQILQFDEFKVFCPEELPVPSTLESIFSCKIQMLDPTCMVLAQFGSVLGDSFTYGDIYSLFCEFSAEKQMSPFLNKLTKEKIVKKTAGNGLKNSIYIFSNPVIRKLVYNTINPKSKKDFHITVAKNVEKKGNIPMAVHHYTAAIQCGYNNDKDFLKILHLSEICGNAHWNRFNLLDAIHSNSRQIYLIQKVMTIIENSASLSSQLDKILQRQEKTMQTALDANTWDIQLFAEAIHIFPKDHILYFECVWIQWKAILLSWFSTDKCIHVETILHELNRIYSCNLSQTNEAMTIGAYTEKQCQYFLTVLARCCSNIILANPSMYHKLSIQKFNGIDGILWCSLQLLVRHCLVDYKVSKEYLKIAERVYDSYLSKRDQTGGNINSENVNDDIFSEFKAYHFALVFDMKSLESVAKNIRNNDLNSFFMNVANYKDGCHNMHTALHNIDKQRKPYPVLYIVYLNVIAKYLKTQRNVEIALIEEYLDMIDLLCVDEFSVQWFEPEILRLKACFNALKTDIINPNDDKLRNRWTGADGFLLPVIQVDDIMAKDQKDETNEMEDLMTTKEIEVLFARALQMARNHQSKLMETRCLTSLIYYRNKHRHNITPDNLTSRLVKDLSKNYVQASNEEKDLEDYKHAKEILEIFNSSQIPQ